MPDLQIMILDDQLHEPVQSPPALFLRQSIDLLDVVAYAENGLPARDRVRADHGMYGLKFCADVLGSSAGLAV